MPPRLNKRQQRELEELANLGQSSKQQLSDGETSELEIKDVKRPTVGFAAVSVVSMSKSHFMVNDSSSWLHQTKALRKTRTRRLHKLKARRYYCYHFT